MSPIGWPTAGTGNSASLSSTSASLRTLVGIVGGEVLTYVEEQGATPMRRLIRELEWPSQVVIMAVGALVREGLVQAMSHELEVIIEPAGTSRTCSASAPEGLPEMWGG